MAIAMSSNQADLGLNSTTPLCCQTFGLSQILIDRNGLPIVGTPITTNFKKCRKSDYQNHFVMVFGLTSTQEASHDFIYPELTNGSVSVKLSF